MGITLAAIPIGPLWKLRLLKLFPLPHPLKMLKLDSYLEPWTALCKCVQFNECEPQQQSSHRHVPAPAAVGLRLTFPQRPVEPFGCWQMGEPAWSLTRIQGGFGTCGPGGDRRGGGRGSRAGLPWTRCPPRLSLVVGEPAGSSATWTRLEDLMSPKDSVCFPLWGPWVSNSSGQKEDGGCQGLGRRGWGVTV